MGLQGDMGMWVYKETWTHGCFKETWTHEFIRRHGTWVFKETWTRGFVKNGNTPNHSNNGMRGRKLIVSAC